MSQHLVYGSFFPPLFPPIAWCAILIIMTTCERRSGPVDYLIKAYDEHEHSVYSVAWGADVGSPYVFASLSYDGRVVINQVPYAEVERIQQEEM